MNAAPARPSPRLRSALCMLAALALGACGGGDDGRRDRLADEDGAAAATSAPTVAESGRELDFAVEGLAKLVLQDETGGERRYRRDGRLTLDASGRLVHADGGRVVGRTEAGAAFQPLPAAATTLPPQATRHLRVQGSLEPLQAGEAMSTWQDGSPLPADVVEAQRVRRAFGTALQTADGQPMHLLVSFSAPQPVDPSPEAPRRWQAEAVIFSLAEGEVARAGMTLQLLPSGLPDATQASTLQIAAAHPALAPTIELDLSGLREAPGPFTVERLEQDGHAAGRLEGASIAADGRVTIHYDNGVAIPAGQLALARFQAVVRMAGGRFVDTRCGQDCEAPIFVVGEASPGTRLRVSPAGPQP